jgi:hypothetical protein
MNSEIKRVFQATRWPLHKSANRRQTLGTVGVCIGTRMGRDLSFPTGETYTPGNEEMGDTGREMRGLNIGFAELGGKRMSKHWYSDAWFRHLKRLVTHASANLVTSQSQAVSCSCTHFENFLDLWIPRPFLGARLKITVSRGSNIAVDIRINHNLFGRKLAGPH